MAVHVIRNAPWWADAASSLAKGLLAQAFERTRAAEADTAERAMAQHLAGVLGGDQPQPHITAEPATLATPPADVSGGLQQMWRQHVGGASIGDGWTPPVASGAGPNSGDLLVRALTGMPQGVRIAPMLPILESAMKARQAESNQAQMASAIEGLDPRGNPTGTLQRIALLEALGLKLDPEVLKVLNPAMTYTVQDLGDRVAGTVFDPGTGRTQPGAPMLVKGIDPTRQYVANAGLAETRIREGGAMARHNTPSASALVSAGGGNGNPHGKMVGKQFDRETGQWQVLYADGTQGTVGGGGGGGRIPKGLNAELFGSRDKTGALVPGVVHHARNSEELADLLASTYQDPNVLAQAYRLAYGTPRFETAIAGGIPTMSDSPFYKRVPARVKRLLDGGTAGDTQPPKGQTPTAQPPTARGPALNRYQQMAYDEMVRGGMAPEKALRYTLAAKELQRVAK